GKPVVIRRQMNGSGVSVYLESAPRQDPFVPTPVPDVTAPTYQAPPTSIETGPVPTYESPDAFRKEPEVPNATVEIQAKPDPSPTMPRLTGSEPQSGTYKLTTVRSSSRSPGGQPELEVALAGPDYGLRQMSVDNLASVFESIVQNATDKEIFKKSRME